MRCALVIAGCLGCFSLPLPAQELDGRPLPPGAIARLGSPRLRSHSDYSNGLQLSPNGRFLVLAAGNDNLWWFDPTSGKTLHRHGYPMKGIKCGRVHDDGKLSLFHTKEGTDLSFVARFDPASGKVIGEVRITSSSVDDAIFDKHAKFVATWREKTLAVYDSATGEKLWGETFDTAIDFGATFVNDNTIAVGLNTGVFLHDVRSRKGTISLELAGEGRESGGHSAPVASPDGSLLAAAFKEKQVVVWDAATGKVRHRFAKQKLPLGFTADGKKLVTATDRDTIGVWNLETGQRDRETVLANADRSVLGRDGKQLFTRLHDSVVIHDLLPNGDVKLAAMSADVPGLPDSLRFDADGALVGRLSDWGGWVVWKNREANGELLRPHGSGTVIGLSADRTRFLTFDDDRFIIGGTEPSGAATFKYGLTNTSTKSLAALSADGSIAVAAHAEGLTRFDMSTRTSRLIRSPFQERGAGLVATISADGRVAATEGYDAVTDARYVELYSLKTDRPLRDVRTRGPCERLDLSPDGSRLAIGTVIAGRNDNPQKSLVVVETETGLELIRLGPIEKGEGIRMALSADGRTVAWQVPNELHVYELLTGQRRAKLPTPKYELHGLALAPDGRTLAAAAAGWPVILWDIAGDTQFARLQPDEYAGAWERLAKPEADAAYLLLRRMQLTPTDTLRFLSEQLKPAAPPAPEVLKKWIDKLDAPAFADRQQAVKELRALGELAVPELRRVLETTDSAEVRERIEKLLTGTAKPTADAVRASRAIELLEWIGTPAAKAQLKALTAGAEGARQTREAVAALSRMK